jgi:NTE family protein
MTGQKNARPRSGLVLGGGAARGIAHLGVLRVLEREGYPIDLIAGTSMGGLIAGTYALLGSVDAVLAQASLPTSKDVTRFSPTPRPEISESRMFRAWLQDLFAGRNLTDLRWPVGVTAVDLDSGEEIWLNRGPAAPALWATSSLPGIYAPVVINGRRLIDGGVLNPVPVDLAQRMGATVTLAVDVLPDANRPAARMTAGMPYHQAMRTKFGVAMDITAKAFDIMTNAQRDCKLRAFPPDLLITPDLHGMSAIDYDARDEFMARGEAAAEAVLPQIRALRDRLLAARTQGNGYQAAEARPAVERME